MQITHAALLLVTEIQTHYSPELLKSFRLSQNSTHFPSLHLLFS